MPDETVTPLTSADSTIEGVGAPPAQAEIEEAPRMADDIASAIRRRRRHRRHLEGKDKASGPLWQTIAVVLLRFIIGTVFIASGFAKSIDPWGSVYKIGEYAAVWQITVPHSLIVAAAVGLSTLEFVSGVMLLLGCYRRSITVVLTLLMAGMLPLSAYIYIADPVADCGCFGDLWVISNGATLLKNVFLTAGIVFLLIKNRTVRCVVSPYVQWLPLVLSVAYPLMLSLDGYNLQPLLDFRSYAAGKPLAEVEGDGEETAPSYAFIYEKDGERRSFTVDSLPDSTWTYIDREELSDGDAVHDDPFTIYDTDGNDVASEVIAQEGPQVLVCIPSLSVNNMSYTYYLNELYSLLERHDIPMIGVIGGDDRDVALWADLSMAEYPLYNGDALQIKELVRGRGGIVILRDGKVAWKSSAGPLLSTLDAGDAFSRDDLSFLNASPDGEARLRWLTGTYLTFMLIIIAVNNGVLAVLTLWRRRMVKKMRSVAHHQKKS